MKFELISDKKKAIELGIKTCYRILAKESFLSSEMFPIRAGQFGGWIEKEENLDQEDNSWIEYGSVVIGNSRVSGNSYIAENKPTEDGSLIRDSKITSGAYISGSDIKSSTIIGGKLIECDIFDSFVKTSSLLCEEIINSIICQREEISKFPVPPPNDIELIYRAVHELPENLKAELYRRLVDEI